MIGVLNFCYEHLLFDHLRCVTHLYCMNMDELQAVERNLYRISNCDNKP